MNAHTETALDSEQPAFRNVAECLATYYASSHHQRPVYKPAALAPDELAFLERIDGSLHVDDMANCLAGLLGVLESAVASGEFLPADLSRALYVAARWAELVDEAASVQGDIGLRLRFALEHAMAARDAGQPAPKVG